MRTTLESVLTNTRLPEELLVIDDDVMSEALIAEMREAFVKRDVTFSYHRKADAGLRRGLSESKNWAARLAAHEVLCFLDDDVVLEPDYFAALFAVWKEHKHDQKLLGVGGRVINNRPTTAAEKLFRRVFGLAGRYGWDVNDIGFQVWDEGVKETEHAYYIHGGVSSYRTTILRVMPFALFSGGRTGLEDVEHCLRAKRAGYHFFYVPSAALYHHPQPAGRDQAFASGKKESSNRKEIFRKHCPQDARHRLQFLWANTGWILKKILAGRFAEAGGMVVGLAGR